MTPLNERIFNMLHYWGSFGLMHRESDLLLKSSGGQSTQIKYLSKSTDTYNKILLQ